MGDLSVLESRFYAGIFALFLFGILGLVLLASGLVWEGVALLAMLTVFSVLAYIANKNRCPNCNRLYLDSKYGRCPHCGFVIKEKEE